MIKKIASYFTVKELIYNALLFLSIKCYCVIILSYTVIQLTLKDTDLFKYSMLFLEAIAVQYIDIPYKIYR